MYQVPVQDEQTRNLGGYNIFLNMGITVMLIRLAIKHQQFPRRAFELKMRLSPFSNLQNQKQQTPAAEMTKSHAKKQLNFALVFNNRANKLTKRTTLILRTRNILMEKICNTYRHDVSTLGLVCRKINANQTM